jgi:hypothetical protein
MAMADGDDDNGNVVSKPVSRMRPGVTRESRSILRCDSDDGDSDSGLIGSDTISATRKQNAARYDAENRSIVIAVTRLGSLEELKKDATKSKG